MACVSRASVRANDDRFMLGLEIPARQMFARLEF
jgi:hypothetical protein